MLVRRRIPIATQRILWASSGGYCQNPSCNTDLFAFFESGDITSIEELAHIIGFSTNAARGKSKLSKGQRNSFDNIILLCPTCHTLIDKAKKHYSVSILGRWKRDHTRRIRTLFRVSRYSSRVKLRRALEALLTSNKSVFDTYGPFSDHGDKALADAELLWKKSVLEIIIPNNNRLAELLVTNRNLLRDKELSVMEAFLRHKEAFEFNHLSGDKNSAAPLFPMELNTILRGRKHNA